MNTKVIYNGVDITADIDITSCIITDSNGGKQDHCRISFANGGKIWNEWQPQKNDEVQVKSGNADTGRMFINGIESNSNSYVLVLLPTPTTAKRRKTRIWRKVRLSEIVSDVARNIGFKMKFYGFKDYFYENLSQMNITDLAFMDEMCRREGYNVKVYDKTIIIYDERHLYSTESSGVIKPTDCSAYAFYNENAPLSAVTVAHYDVFKKYMVSHTAKDATVEGGSANIKLCIDNRAQAERWANNILHRNNDYIDCGTLTIKDADVFASGSVVNLEGFKGYNGAWYINESAFDVVNKNCTFKINKIRGVKLWQSAHLETRYLR